MGTFSYPFIFHNMSEIERTKEYLLSLAKDSKELFEKRQQVIDIITEYFGEDRTWNVVSTEDYKERYLQYLQSYFKRQLDPIYSILNKDLLSYSVEELQEGSFNLLFENHYVSFFSEFLSYSEDESYIIIYFPEIILTNEAKLKHTIKDVYVKIRLRGASIIDFTINRATYTESELCEGYVHSHTKCRSFSKKQTLITYTSMCLGSGPINNTLKTLRTSGFDLDFVGLFCQELENYLKVESLQGGPYIKMSSLTARNFQSIYTFPDTTFKEIAPEILQQCVLAIIKAGFLTFSYHNGTYVITNSFIELLQKSSEVLKNLNIPNFESFYKLNKVPCVFNGIECKLLQNTIDEDTKEKYNSWVGTPILVFKNKKIPFNVIQEESNNNSYIVQPGIISSILYYITIKINQYGYYKQATKSE